ncbi:UNVERIFIED_CONTAM: hypothetical protein Scaly_2738000 [Sesamum calycinum]|uniref:Uncharacterized protein n=1 Tax=Sesamum calycinum TaxID=2727403 RepID=A0AAW2J219_9LAMI
MSTMEKKTSLFHCSVIVCTILTSRFIVLMVCRIGASGFYSNPDQNMRSHSWNLLRQLRRKSTLSWMCYGDFNATLLHIEKESLTPTPLAQIREFRKAIEDVGLMDLDYVGPKFT